MCTQTTNSEVDEVQESIYPIFNLDFKIKYIVSNSLYFLTWQVLDAFTHGALPQRRERLWIVGVNSYAMKGALVQLGWVTYSSVVQ